MARNYAALPHEYLEEFADLTDEEIGRLVMALVRYSATGQEPELKGNERFLWRRVMAQENRFQESYDEIAKARSESARKAAKSRWSMREDADACERMPSDASDANTNTETETNTETHISPSFDGRDSRAARFTPPTTEEVASYARERNSSVDPERFMDFYASKGWKIGNAPMEDWHAAFRNWEREEHTRNSRASPKSQKASDALRNCDTPVSTPDHLATLERLERLRQQMKAGTG